MAEKNTLYYEQLKNRSLWVDGDSTSNKNGLYDLILSGENISDAKVSEIDNEIRQFQKLTDITFLEKNSPDYTRIKDNFIISEKYIELSLEKFYATRLMRLVKKHKMSEAEMSEATNRIVEELDLYRAKGLEDVLRTAIYIVDALKENNIVWGPGRGSACCSYLLFLTELHDVDSLKFELAIDEFLR